MELKSFVLLIIERPAMYSVNNVEELNLIIAGYNYGSVNKENSNLLLNFRNYVNKYFKSKDDVDWPRLIRFYSASDKHSLELFSNLFNQYIKGMNES